MIVLRRKQDTPDTFLELTDTPSAYDFGKYPRSTASGIEWSTVSGNPHSELDELDYVSAGHTGFSPTIHTHIESDVTDLDKYTQTQVDTISGSLNAEIDSDIVTFSGTINHDTILNTHNLTTDIDHNQLTNYSADEHRTIDDDAVGATDLWSASKISSEITTISGKLDDHDELNNLDYASAGHTGFASSNDLATTSGTLQEQLDNTTFGNQTIVSGSNNVVVSFDTNQPDTNYYINATMKNTTDPDPSMYTKIISDTTVSGFAVLFGGSMISNNYSIDWHIIR